LIVPETVDWLVNHLSLSEEPSNGLVKVQEAPLSSQYVVAELVREGEYAVPKSVDVSVGAVGLPPPKMEYEPVTAY
jgi:hypothetical protein